MFTTKLKNTMPQHRFRQSGTPAKYVVNIFTTFKHVFILIYSSDDHQSIIMSRRMKNGKRSMIHDIRPKY